MKNATNATDATDTGQLTIEAAPTSARGVAGRAD
jgi:hypothetical protein